MPYVPGCDYDLFISYASENNRDDWVRMFKDVLTVELVQLLGRQFSERSVFFDKTELRAGQSFPEALAKGAEGSAVLIPVLSPGYLDSDWCRRERLAFRTRLPEGASESECLAPVMVRPIDETRLDPLLRDAQRLSFLPPKSSEPLPSGSPPWMVEVKRLALQLKAVLEQLRLKCKPVFVGRALPDREGSRTLCAAELEKRLLRVAPLPTLDSKDSLTQALKQATLSVHFIGGASEDARLAADIAAAVCPGATILYRPFGASIAVDELLWLEEFERSLKGPRNYQRIEDKDDQELVAVLEQEITRIRPRAASSTPAGVSVICDEPDLPLARLLRQEIQAREQFAVSYPAFLEAPLTPSERVRQFTELLKTSQALLFCWGKAGEATLLQRLAAHARSEAPLEWYLAEPDLEGKRRQFPRAICQAGDEFRYEALEPFLGPLRGRRPSA
jgi:TIR domain